MAYISPNTDIVLCRSIPLDNSYDHTITFANQNAQLAYFNSKAIITLSTNSYQRTMKETLRVNVPMGTAILCNYLYFRNTTLDGKYFFAFITGWEYVNNVTTEISYEIDVFQTFMFDYNIQPSFIEREHSNTDIVGENTVPENLEQGEYFVNGSTALDFTAIEGYLATNACALFYTTFNDDADCTNYTGTLVNSVYSGLNIIKKQTVSEINTFLNKVITAGKVDGIVYAYMCPFSPTYPNAMPMYSCPRNIAKSYLDIGGYYPKNNKLYTAPFYTLRIRTDTDAQEFPMEFFSDSDECTFTMFATVLPEPCLTLVPRGFLRNSDAVMTGNRMTIDKFPQIAFNTDVFKVYLAQNAGSLAASMISTVGNGVTGIATSALAGRVGGAVNGTVSTLTSIGETLGKLRDISIKPPQLNGSQTSLADYAIGAKRFYADIISVRPEFARIIDDYFNMFGYATHRVKTPNIFGRPHWNYVKTKGVVIDVMNAPQPYVQKLVECFDRGITFWHNPSEVGDYSLDNRPV